jgi:signal transduction histidine kinase
MDKAVPPELQKLYVQLRNSGGISAFICLTAIAVGYFAFIGEVSWQRVVVLPILFVITFPLISFVMRNGMGMTLRPLIDVLASDAGWAGLSGEQQIRVFRAVTTAPWIMGALTVVMWTVMSPIFMYFAEHWTPGPVHSYVDLLLGLMVAFPAIFLANVLRAELLLRPYLARARAQANTKDVHLRFALTVQQRLMIASILIGPYMMIAFSILAYRQLALAHSVPEALGNFFHFGAFFLAICSLLTVCFAYYLIRVVKQPLDQIQSALSGSEAQAPDTFDEFGVIHQVLVERNALEQAKQEFFAVVSHELRSPLMAIESFLRLLADGVYGDVPERVRKKSETAVTNADRLLRLVNDILDAEKLQSGKFECIFAPSNAKEIVDRTVRAVADLAEVQGIEIVVETCDETIECDEERIVQVLINFLTNAVKNADGKPVNISSRRDGAMIEFGVRDKGDGIPVDMQAVVFEKFRQLQSDSAEKKKKGTGLGLPIAKALVEQHGGEIGVQSNVGEGSYFFARIPIEQPKPMFQAFIKHAGTGSTT